MSPLLELNGLTVELPTSSGWVRPVNDVSLRIEAGDCLGLVGESGSGKTMLALALMGLLPEGSRIKGEAWLEERDSLPNANGAQKKKAKNRRNLVALAEREWRTVRGREIGMVFQEPMTSLNPVMGIGEQIDEAIRAHEAGLSERETRQRTLEAMRKASMNEPEARAEQFPHQLSGGLRQRALIAMALATSPH